MTWLACFTRSRWFGPWTRALRLLSISAALALAARSARADGPLAENGEPITTSSYTVDFTRGPVLSSSRATGLAGAFSAIAEGAEGGLSNPAAVATRYIASVDLWDYWLAFSLTYPFQSNDFFNSGDYLEHAGDLSETSSFFLNPGLYVQLWGLGFGLDMDIQVASVRAKATEGEEEGSIRLTLITNHVQVGYLFFDGQLALGGGLTILNEVVAAGLIGARREVYLDEVGFGGEVGALIRPNGKQWRIGAGFYSGVRTRTDPIGDSGDIQIDSFYFPRAGVRPWQASLAFAYQFGERPLNPRFTYVEEYAQMQLREIERRRQAAAAVHQRRLAEIRAAQAVDVLDRLAEEERAFAKLDEQFDRERADLRKAAWRELRAFVRRGWSRRYLLVVTELSLTGAVDDAVGVESFLLQTVQRSGEQVTATPRVAVESEVWPFRMKLRAGLYLEPTRFEQSSARLHGTFGMDIKLGVWSVFGVWPEDYLWQLSTAIDLTSDYSALSVGVNGWY